jgi:hypothetical protein
MYRENPEEADDRQYYDYHLDRNGSSLEAENQVLRQPLVIGSVCTCTKFRETPMINGKHICSICHKPIMQTDL